MSHAYSPEYYPDPDASHLHSEIGYASLPPPQLENDSLATRFPSPRDGATLVERFAPHWIDLLIRPSKNPA